MCIDLLCRKFCSGDKIGSISFRDSYRIKEWHQKTEKGFLVLFLRPKAGTRYADANANKKEGGQ